jgi:hypothetical protein
MLIRFNIFCGHARSSKGPPLEIQKKDQVNAWVEAGGAASQEDNKEEGAF